MDIWIQSYIVSVTSLRPVYWTALVVCLISQCNHTPEWAAPGPQLFLILINRKNLAFIHKLFCIHTPNINLISTRNTFTNQKWVLTQINFTPLHQQQTHPYPSCRCIWMPGKKLDPVLKTPRIITRDYVVSKERKTKPWSHKYWANAAPIWYKSVSWELDSETRDWNCSMNKITTFCITY